MLALAGETLGTPASSCFRVAPPFYAAARPCDCQKNYGNREAEPVGQAYHCDAMTQPPATSALAHGAFADSIG